MSNSQAFKSGVERAKIRPHNDLQRDMLGISLPSIQELARAQSTLLITGEPGTAKEALAGAIHRNSSRAGGPLVTLNCNAVPESLLELELFGHAPGASLGTHVGRVQSAHGGTLFLDEVARLPLTLQVKLLRLLQYQEFTATDDGRILSADVRVIAATSVPLESAVQAGTFRDDLRVRLQMALVHCPSLRKRPADLETLVQHYFLVAKESLDRRDVSRISPSALQLLCDHAWPGNLRELKDTMAQAVTNARASEILPQDLPDSMTKSERVAHSLSPHAQLTGTMAR